MYATAWSTDNELEYLHLIGQFYSGTQALPKSVLLRQYCDAAARRHDWGIMDRDLIIRQACCLLTKAVLAESAEKEYPE